MEGFKTAQTATFHSLPASVWNLHILMDFLLPVILVLIAKQLAVMEIRVWVIAIGNFSSPSLCVLNSFGGMMGSSFAFIVLKNTLNPSHLGLKRKTPLPYPSVFLSVLSSLCRTDFEHLTPWRKAESNKNNLTLCRNQAQTPKTLNMSTRWWEKN